MEVILERVPGGGGGGGAAGEGFPMVASSNGGGGGCYGGGTLIAGPDPQVESHHITRSIGGWWRWRNW